MRSGRFRTNSPPVVYETVDHETIVVNLDTGSYYDLNESAGYVFGLLAAAPTAAEMAQRVQSRYGIELGEAETVVDDLLGKLLEEQLAMSADNAVASEAGLDGQPAPKPWSAPVVNKYTDMQELLLLDPVHEVDETGWPSRA